MRYFFHLEGLRDVLQDETGEEFLSIEEARAHAVDVAKELARNRRDRVGVGQRLLVTDVRGDALFCVPLLLGHV